MAATCSHRFFLFCCCIEEFMLFWNLMKKVYFFFFLGWVRFLIWYFFETFLIEKKIYFLHTCRWPFWLKSPTPMLHNKNKIIEEPKMEITSTWLWINGQKSINIFYIIINYRTVSLERIVNGKISLFTKSSNVETRKGLSR